MASEELLVHADDLYRTIQINKQGISREELERGLERIKVYALEHFPRLPSEEKQDAANCVLLRIYEVAKLMAYADRKDLLPPIHAKAQEVHRIVEGGDIVLVSAIEHLAKVADQRETFRGVLPSKESLDKHEPWGKEDKDSR
jgi:hypothetical protein